MPLQRQVISWPLTGGIDTKNSPLMIQPGSHIQLDNVRQERTNEWRARNGTNRSALDDMPQSLPPVMVAPVQFGSGLVALTAAPGAVSPTRTAVATYAAALSSARWQRLDSGSAQSGAKIGAPFITARRTLFPTISATELLTHASNGNTAMTFANTGRLLAGLGDGVAIGDGVASAAFVTQLARYKRAVFGATYYCLFRVTSGGSNVNVDRYSEAGALIGTTLMGADGFAGTGQYIDAIKYPGAATVTLVYRNNAAGFRIIEYNDTTDTVASGVTVVQLCDNALALLPDPDGSGVRFVALSSTLPETRVLRCTSVGAVTTNEQVDTNAARQIAGCGYSAGAGYQLVYDRFDGAGLSVVKKRSGVISAASLFAPDTRFKLHSNAWREAGDDHMRAVYAFHSLSATDPQDSYFVGAFPFDNGATADSSLFPAQAKMLPLDAGPIPSNQSSLPQVVRIGTRTYEVPLLRLARSGSVIGQTKLNVDVFRFTDLQASAPATLSVGAPKSFSAVTLIPSGVLMEASVGRNVNGHGLNVIPPQPILTPSTGGGGLNLLQTYQVVTVIVARSDSGDEWRSPPSIPATVTLAGTQDSISANPNLAIYADDAGRTVTLEYYQTKGNGSVFQKAAESTGALSTFASTFGVMVSDATLSTGAFLYTGAELSSVVTPPFSHIESHGGRAWGIHRDYKNILCPSKTISNGRSPEWANELQLSIVDEEGDLTNIASMDDKLIAFKASAIYVVTGDGLNNGGAGSAHVVTKIDSDVGAIVGSPVVSTGSEVFFVSARGIYMIDRSHQVSFVGAPVDQFLNQPLIQTKETIVGAVFSPATNEVRFQTTNYRLVFDRLRNIWYRDTGAGMQNVVATCMVGTKQALFKSDGTMWIEADHTVVTDNSVAYNSIIRSAWVRAAGTDGRIRLYMARLIMNRTAAGGTPNPTLSIYYDNDDSLFETYTPSVPIAGLVNRISAQPRRHRCSTFSLAILLPSNDQLTRLDAWGAEVGTRPGAFRNNSGAERWV